MGVALTGKDTIIISDRTIKDLGDGDTVVLDFPNNLVEGKTGKNGNTIYAYNSTGKNVTCTIRILKGSADDKFFNNQLNLYLQDPAAYTFMKGEFVKRVGDGAGNITSDVYKMNGGIIQKFPNSKENVEGDTEQAVSIWQIIFTNVSRILA